MSETEGVVQFAYQLEPASNPAWSAGALAELNGWRAVLQRLGLVGQEAGRYGGLGFGNLSFRDPVSASRFTITASQTSGEPWLTDDHLVQITGCNLERFWVDAKGRAAPSSETLTHGMIYQADPRVHWVVHSHSPEIFRQYQALRLVGTGPEVPYGSMAMARSVAGLLQQRRRSPFAFVTLGHEDGVFVCGETLAATAGMTVALLARARALADRGSS